MHLWFSVELAHDESHYMLMVELMQLEPDGMYNIIVVLVV